MLILYLIYSAILLTVSYIDVRQGIIPNKFIYPAIAFALVAMFYSPGWQSALLGGVVGTIFLIIPVILYGPERAGIGDVKLCLFLGLILGFPSLVYALIISFVVAAIFALVGIASGKLNRKSTIPFAPFLTLGALVCFVLHFAA